MKRRENLANPRYRRKLSVSYEAGAFGRFSEGVARNLGTARFLVVQSFLVIVWIAVNVLSIAPALGSIPVHLVEPHVLRAGGICRTADLVGTKPTRRPR